MSKAENGFTLVRYQRYKECLTSLSRACEWIALECIRCPLEGDQQCAKKQLPPIFTKDLGENRDITICQDWLALYFFAHEEPPAEEILDK